MWRKRDNDDGTAPPTATRPLATPTSQMTVSPTQPTGPTPTPAPSTATPIATATPTATVAAVDFVALVKDVLASTDIEPVAINGLTFTNQLIDDETAFCDVLPAETCPAP